MEEIKFRCETITPMFLAGADGKTPELRPPSIKGAMRFWWRALHGHLSLKDLKKRESEIFGGTGNVQAKSCFSIRVHPLGNCQQGDFKLVPHKNFHGRAFVPSCRFAVEFALKERLSEDGKGMDFGVDHLKKLFLLTCYLGGFGKRVRRGMGSVDVLSINELEDEIPQTIDLPFIHGLIQHFSPHYTLMGERIAFTFPGRAPKYGYLIKVELGKSYEGEEKLLRKISLTTHDLKRQDPYKYEPSMGFAGRRGRYASPVYVSAVRGSARPLISTLNLAPPSNAGRASLDVQNDFKSAIL